MRVSSISFNDSPVGLEPLELKRLGSLVLLAGPNGAGKSRLLSVLRKRVAREAYDRKYPLASLNGPGISSSESNPHGWPNLSQMKDASNRDDGESAQWKDDHKLYSGLVKYDTSDPKSAVDPVEFIPTGVDLKDSRSLSPTDARSLSASVRSTLGFNALAAGTIAYAQEIWDRSWHATHPSSTITIDRRELAIRELDSLQSIIEDLLGTRLSADDDNHVTLFRRPISAAGLSHGQSILLQFAVALQTQGPHLSETIVLVDEPEQHLHPSAVLQIIDRILKLVPRGQLWVATHSVHVLAAHEPSSIWYMSGGTIHHAGRHPEMVLRGLLGDDKRIGQLRDFLDEPSRLAVIRFSLECLRLPGVVDDIHDAQSAQIHDALTDGCALQTLTLLDIGAGRGRLLAAIADKRAIGGAPLNATLDYVAIEPDADNRANCAQVIESVYGRCDSRAFASTEALLQSRGEHFVDTAILCNVLHEIPPRSWLQFLNGASGMWRALKSEGVLIVVEDHQMPVGEMAHSNGFLVLDTEALAVLFGVTSERITPMDHRRDGRLLAHKISAKFLRNVTSETVIAAVRASLENATRAVRKMREKGPSQSFADGQKHAFWIHQLANATLILQDLVTGEAGLS